MKDCFTKSSHIKIYWYVWLGIVAIVILLRFTIFLGVSQGSRFIYGLTYMLGTWLPIMVLNLIEGNRLRTYLKSHHNQKLAELTYIPILGCDGVGGIRWLFWLYSSDDLDDPEVTTLKQDCRHFIRFMLTVFFTYLVILPILSA